MLRTKATNCAGGKPDLLFVGSRGGPSQMVVLQKPAHSALAVVQKMQSPVQNGLGPIHDAVCFEEAEGRL